MKKIIILFLVFSLAYVLITGGAASTKNSQVLFNILADLDISFVRTVEHAEQALDGLEDLTEELQRIQDSMPNSFVLLAGNSWFENLVNDIVNFIGSSLTNITTGTVLIVCFIVAFIPVIVIFLTEVVEIFTNLLFVISRLIS